MAEYTRTARDLLKSIPRMGKTFGSGSAREWIQLTKAKKPASASEYAEKWGANEELLRRMKRETKAALRYMKQSIYAGQHPTAREVERQSKYRNPWGAGSLEEWLKVYHDTIVGSEPDIPWYTYVWGADPHLLVRALEEFREIDRIKNVYVENPEEAFYFVEDAEESSFYANPWGDGSLKRWEAMFNATKQLPDPYLYTVKWGADPYVLLTINRILEDEIAATSDSHGSPASSSSSSSSSSSDTTASMRADVERRIGRELKSWQNYIVILAASNRNDQKRSDYVKRAEDSAQVLEDLFRQWRVFSSNASRKRQRGSARTSVREQISSLSLNEKHNAFHQAVRMGDAETVKALAPHVAPQ